MSIQYVSVLFFNTAVSDELLFVYSLPQRGSIGDRCFTGGWQLSLMKRMKKRLIETAEHYRQMAAQCTVAPSGESEQEQRTATLRQKEFCEKREK